MASSTINAITSWTLIAECPIPEDINEVLANGEVPHVAFKTLRDSAVFTNKRLIIRDAQGLTGKKVEMYSLPYTSINMWSSENSGKVLDMNAELELWTRAGHFKLKIGKDLNIRAIDRLISNCVLGSD
ncbi:PH domain-containing protein [Rothia aerolata]|uniref:Bacterial Pleckstrin homology domain-containing protein n=1 Tax=Rothia aerolata TaxID=1812262 RepID=A0A917MQN2_9MICC|nr:PH domain-containing protein [Rothia aerolata]GGH57384.1 hypothetical protein GCM10007359_02450 [Rothia aerolata]